MICGLMWLLAQSRGNFDDGDETILKRLQLFSQKTRPVIDNYAKTAKKVIFAGYPV